MANMCENKMYISTPDSLTFQEVKAYIADELNGDITWEEHFEDELQLECYFESRWDFPDKLMQDMTDKHICNTDNLFIRVLSVEECNYYCAFHVFKDGQWKSI